MANIFGNVLRKLRKEKRYSQQQLADLLFVDRTSVANWETGRRVPDAILISRISELLGVDTATLLGITEYPDQKPTVIVVDDESLILQGELKVLQEVLSDMNIIGFNKASEAVSYAKLNTVFLAFLDIEMGRANGLDVCRELLSINPRTNVIYVTAHTEHSLDAWDTSASGFIRKPITPEAIQSQLTKLRYPIHGQTKVADLNQ